MRGKLSLLKPYLHNLFASNQWMEKKKYLNVPTSVDLKSLKQDIKKGASQFSELDKLVEKENEPKYIFISTDNLEQGYMAVTYLAAAFNRKHGVEQDSEWDSRLEIADINSEEWEEDCLRIPVIGVSELKQTMGGGNDPFSMGGLFLQGNQSGCNHTPYWMECVQCSVCILCDEFEFGFGGFYEQKDYSLFHGLNYFQENDKVYVIIMETKDSWIDSDDDTIASDRGIWNSMVLSFAADEVAVKLKEEEAKKYYKLLLQELFRKKNLYTKKGFSYERLINQIICMKENDKCQLMENIVKYAVKDKTENEKCEITNADFSFMDRFLRTNTSYQKSKKKRSAREILMNDLIGMDGIKQQVCNIVNVMKYNQLRGKMNIGGGGYHNVHLMLGAPGTAKTTVAQLMGQIMVEEHLLPDNRFVCINGAELKGKYVGHSAPKTRALFEENDIIVIDEAYSLVGDHGESDSYSKEALAQLIIEMEKHSMDKLVIFAGYGGNQVNEKNNKMKDFLEANPGIKSRITSTIHFKSYNVDEMVEIFMRIAENESYQVDHGVTGILAEHFAKRIYDDNFGNGREARSLLETSVVFAANRIMKQNKKTYSKTEMQTILYEDVASAIEQVEKAESIQNYSNYNRKIGFC